MKTFDLIFYINKFYCGNDVDLSFLPSMMTRKFSKLDKAVLSALYKCYDEKSSPFLAFGSKHGQFERLAKLTEQFKSENEVSPMGFSSSVHNNTIGVFSLLNKIHSPYTAISAGDNTLSILICESFSQLKECGDVLFCYADSCEGKEVAVSALVSKKSSENSIKIRMTNSKKLPEEEEYSAFLKLLSGEEKYFYSPFFRLERL